MLLATLTRSGLDGRISEMLQSMTTTAHKKPLIRFGESRNENTVDLVVFLSLNAWVVLSLTLVYSLQLVYIFVLTEV